MADTTLNIVPAGRNETDLELFGKITRSITASDPDKSLSETIEDLAQAVRIRRDMQIDMGEDPSIILHYPITEKDRHTSEENGELFVKNGYFAKHDLQISCDKNGHVSISVYNDDHLESVRLGSIAPGESGIRYVPGQAQKLENEYFAIGAINLAGADSRLADALSTLQRRWKEDPGKGGIMSSFTIPTGLIESPTVHCAIRPLPETEVTREVKQAAREKYIEMAIETEHIRKLAMQAPILHSDGKYVQENTAFLGIIDKNNGRYHALNPARMDVLIDKYRLYEAKGLEDALNSDFTRSVVLCFPHPNGQNALLTYDEIQQMNLRGEYTRDALEQLRIQERLESAVKDLAARVESEIVHMDLEKEEILRKHPELKDGFTHTCEIVAFPNMDDPRAIPLKISPIETATIKSDKDDPNHISVYSSPVYDFLGREDAKTLAAAVLGNEESVHTIAVLGNRIGPKVEIPEEDITVRLNPDDAKTVRDIHKNPIEKVISFFTSRHRETALDANEERLRNALQKGHLGEALDDRGKLVEAVLEYMNRIDRNLPQEDKLINVQDRLSLLRKADNMRGILGNDILRLQEASKEAMEAYKKAYGKHRDMFVSEAKRLEAQVNAICTMTKSVMFVDMTDKNNAKVTAMIEPGQKITLIKGGVEKKMRPGGFAELFAASLTAQRIISTLEQQRLFSELSSEQDNEISDKNLAGSRHVKVFSLDDTVQFAKERAEKTAVRSEVSKIKADQKRDR